MKGSPALVWEDVARSLTAAIRSSSESDRIALGLAIEDYARRCPNVVAHVQDGLFGNLARGMLLALVSATAAKIDD